MSYDLYFLKKLGSPEVTTDRLAEYFASRPHYSVNEGQCFYENEDTGVYFSFDLTETGGEDFEDEERVEDGLENVDLSFNINYFRPHFFGLEAEPELAALVERFSLLVDDPQNDGMGRGEYSREGFLRGWNAGNLFGYYAFLTHEEAPFDEPPVLPRDVLEAMWRWNFHKEALQASLGEDVYVPPVRLIQLDGRTKRFAVWGDAIPQAFPEVDVLVLVRDELAPRRLFTRKQDMCLVDISEASRALSLARRVSDGGVPYRLFEYDEPPAQVMDLFRTATPVTEQLEGVAYDSVLTQEILDEAKARAARRAESAD